MENNTYVFTEKVSVTLFYGQPRPPKEGVQVMGAWVGALVEIQIGSNPLMSIMDAPLDFN